MDDVFNTHNEVSDAGRDLFDSKTLHHHEEEEVNEAMSSLHTNIQKIQQSTKDKKIKYVGNEFCSKIKLRIEV